MMNKIGIFLKDDKMADILKQLAILVAGMNMGAYLFTYNEHFIFSAIPALIIWFIFS